jgi:Uma2 family endonuclease
MAPVKVVRPRVSYADLERAPEDGRRYELYDGEVYVVPAPLPIHQIVQIEVAVLLRAYAAERGGFSVPSPIDVVFSQYDVLQPDIVYFSPDRAHLVDIHRPIHDAPDLCVEVMSPSTRETDRGRKMQMFARYGVREYWIADPDTRTIELYRLHDDGYLLAATVSGNELVSSPLLPGLMFPASAVFPPGRAGYRLR